jgi:hypothetical protein
LPLLVAVAVGLTGAACGSTGTRRSSTTTTGGARAGGNIYEAACRNALVASNPGSVASDALTELSGLAASGRRDGVLWAHNDSGDSARVFAVGSDGADLGQYTLSGAGAVDWEDIAAGPGPDAGQRYLYLADIGDNNGSRASVQVYRVIEPSVAVAPSTAAPQVLTGVDRLTFRYPDGPHDAEAFVVDPVSGELFVVTKSFSGTAQVFRAPAGLAAGTTTTLTPVATVPLGLGAAVTAADVTPAGDVVALRTYGSVVLFPRAGGKGLADAFDQARCDGAVASEPQGEALAFTRDGRSYVTASEGGHPALHRFTAP